eukprot:13732813-Alexandrium_andersonii.AAC.1
MRGGDRHHHPDHVLRGEQLHLAAHRDQGVGPVRWPDQPRQRREDGPHRGARRLAATRARLHDAARR